MDFVREVSVRLSESDYKRLLRVAVLDFEECATFLNRDSQFVPSQLVKDALRRAVDVEIETGESYWGEYQEDYLGLIEKRRAQ